MFTLNRNLEGNEIGESRPIAGLSRIASFCAFRNGPSSSSSSTRQVSENNQSTVGYTGAGATAISVGGGGSMAQIDYTSNSYSADAPIIAAATGAAFAFGAEAVDANASVSATAIANNSIVSTNALSLGAEVVQNNTALVNNSINAVSAFGAEALASNNAATNSALSFGAEVANNAFATVNNNSSRAFAFGSESLDFATRTINSSVSFAAAGQEMAYQALSEAQHNQMLLQSELAQITANAAPQTSAAQSEILAGYTPTDNGASILSGWWTNEKIITFATLAGFAITAYVFLKSKGKTA